MASSRMKPCVISSYTGLGTSCASLNLGAKRARDPRGPNSITRPPRRYSLARAPRTDRTK
eukprot:10394940-Alexandrium_andersonii.AAC.1